MLESFSTFVSRDDAFSQCQAAWLLFPPTAPFSLHLQQIGGYPKRVVAHLTIAVLTAPEKNSFVFLNAETTESQKNTQTFWILTGFCRKKT